MALRASNSWPIRSPSLSATLETQTPAWIGNQLSGHVVPEVLVDGRWELYDPDYRAYYLNRQGQVASVVDIQNDGTLMTAPLLRVAGALDGSYGALLAAIYLNVDDNYSDSSLMYASAAPFGPALDLPAGATLEFRGQGAIAVPTVEPGTAVEAASLKLQLPPGFTGTVRLPPVLTDVVGDGRVVWLWQTADVPPEGLAASIMNRYQGTPSVGITTIDVEQVGPQGLTLTMMVNPSLAPRGATLSARLIGPSVSGIEVDVSAP